MLYRPAARLFRDVQHTVKPVEQPIGWPVTLQDIKRRLDFEETTEEEDAELESHIPAAVHMVETDCQRALCPRGWELYMDDFPWQAIELRRPPIIGGIVITYTDPQGVSQTLDSSLYDTDVKSEPGRIIPADGDYWPDTKSIPNAITVAFEAGYATSPIPPTLIEAVILAVKALYLGCEPGESYWAKINRNRWEGGI